MRKRNPLNKCDERRGKEWKRSRQTKGVEPPRTVSPRGRDFLFQFNNDDSASGYGTDRENGTAAAGESGIAISVGKKSHRRRRYRAEIGDRRAENCRHRAERANSHVEIGSSSPPRAGYPRRGSCRISYKSCIPTTPSSNSVPTPSEKETENQRKHTPDGNRGRSSAPWTWHSIPEPPGRPSPGSSHPPRSEGPSC